MARLTFSWGEPTRLATLRPGLARAILAGLILLIAWGVTLPAPNPSGQPGAGDAALYRAIAGRVAAGEPYHAAAASEQRQRGYPLRPFTTMRQPLLAEIGATVGPNGADLLVRLLGIATVMATAMRLFHRLAQPAGGIALVLAAASVGILSPGMWVWHELWAGSLVALALACRTERNWPVAVVLGLAAALIRELAFPLLPLMAFAALLSGRRREAAGWGAAALMALAALYAHATLATAMARPGDLTSPGWFAHGGWGFDLLLARHCALFLLLPPWVAAIAVPLALLGWAAWRDDYALRVSLMLATWLGVFLFAGRPDNDYWGFLLAPLLPIGLAIAPAALRDLLRQSAPAAQRAWRPALS